jgi:hypothetical protein
MANLKYFDSDTNTWKTLVVGAQGPQGIQGIQGETGSGPVNAIINGAFEINQRNFSSSTASDTYGFDRWQMFTAGDGSTTYSAQTFTPGTGPAGYESANFARLVSASQTSSAAVSRLQQAVEDVRTFAGQTITVSFFAKAATGTPKIALELSQSFGSGGSSLVNTIGGQATISTAWARYSLTVSVPSVSGKTIGAGSLLRVNIYTSAGTDFNARTGSLGIQSNTFDIWGVQLEAGSTATPFRRNANSLQGELAACQRYFFRIADSTPSRGIYGSGVVRSGNIVLTYLAYPVTMRVTPAVSATGNIRALPGTSAGAATLNGPTGNTVNTLLDWTVSGLTQGHGVIVQGDDQLNSSLSFSAEL